MRFDWPALIRLGLNGLGLTPDRFWALTPAELMVMLGKDGAAAPLGRQRLEELALAFPDSRVEPSAAAAADDQTRSDGS